MNDLEKTIVYLDMNIDDYSNKEIKTFENKQGVTSKRNQAQVRLDRISSKVKRLNQELDKLKVKKISTLTVPVIGFAGFSIAAIFASPIALTVTSTIIGGTCGYRFASDIVKYKLLNEKDNLLLERLFPTIEGKAIELDNAILKMENCKDKLEELTKEEEKLSEEYEELHDGVEKLKEVRESMYSLHIKKLSREYLPYHTSLEDVLNRTIDNPQKFYTDVCSVLTNEEKKDIVSDMPNKSCENCQNHTCRLTQEEKDKMIDCKAWYNEAEIGKSKVLRR